MFNFFLEKSAIYQAIKWGYLFRLISRLKLLTAVLFVILLLLFVFAFPFELFSDFLLRIILGFSFIAFGFLLTFSIKEKFFNEKVKKPKLVVSLKEAADHPERFNLAEFLDFEVARAVAKAFKFTKSRGFSKVSSSSLTYFLLKDNPEIYFIFSRCGIGFREAQEIFKSHSRANKEGEFKGEYSNDFKSAILESFKIAKEKGHKRVKVEDMITALAEHNPVFTSILIKFKLRSEDIHHIAWWLESIKRDRSKIKKFWEWHNLLRRGSLAKDWASGYTVNLDQFSFDFSEDMKAKRFPEIVGYKQEIAQLERILSRREINNVLLAGKPGVGRESIILGLTRKSVLGESLDQVNFKKVVKLDLSSILAQAKDNDEVEDILTKIFNESISAGNIILVIEEIHNYLGNVQRPGAINISGVISKYLHLPEFQVIATTDYSGLHISIEQNPTILSLFEKVEVAEISPKETLMTLETLIPYLEKKYKVFVSYPALRNLIDYCDKYLQDQPFPKKALDLLDELMIYVSLSKDNEVKPKHVASLFSQKTQIPVGEIEGKEKKILLNLESLIHKRIINQEEAVKEISSALRRARSEVSAREGPMGTFLFLGPTGVGKTETAKALSQIYFGSERRMIRLDMSEFQSVGDIKRLIGSAGQEGLLTTRIREDPFSLVLLDEFEKAHPNILNLFLQVLDEGHITDGLGRKVSFQNSILIATSNAGYLVILEALKKKTDFSKVKKELFEYIFQNKIFRPELINRFDGVIIFKSLSKKNLLDISELLLMKIKKSLEKKNVDFEITLPLKERIVDLGYNPTFGAREMKRVIQDEVENVLAEALLADKIKGGDKIEIDPKRSKIIIKGR